MRKFSSQSRINQGQQVVQQLGKSHVQLLIHQMSLSAHYRRNFDFFNFSRRIMERVFVWSILNIRNESLFSGFMENQLERVTNKSTENLFTVLTIWLSCARILSPWTTLKDVYSLIHGLANRFSFDLPNLAFHLSVIKLFTIKTLARPMKALVKGVGQWDLSAPVNCTSNGDKSVVWLQSGFLSVPIIISRQHSVKFYNFKLTYYFWVWQIIIYFQ